MEYKRKLIEVALPLETINKESAREKSIRRGHPSTLHLWWARRPLAAARAVIWASLVDDPSGLTDEFHTEEAQNAERERLFGVLSRLVKWENFNNRELWDEAKAEIMKSTGGSPPCLLDPFAGGGSIPLEAQRLGLTAHASDLNPVAVMINKAIIEIPPRFAGRPPVNPESGKANRRWAGALGLAEDVRYYGEWIRQEALKRVGYVYPTVKDDSGREHAVIAWIWVRTAKCPNPACGCEMPLANSFLLSKKNGREAWIEPAVNGQTCAFTVRKGKCPKGKETNKVGRGGVFVCPKCGGTALEAYLKREGKEGRLGMALMAVVAADGKGKLFFSPDAEQIRRAATGKPDRFPDGQMSANPRWFSPPGFGMTDFSQMFTDRQLTVLSAFSDILGTAKAKIIADAGDAGKGGAGLEDGGDGLGAYAEAVCVYLSFLLDNLAAYGTTFGVWRSDNEGYERIFSRQAIAMVWDFPEMNLLDGLFYKNRLNSICDCLINLGNDMQGYAIQYAAQSKREMAGVMVSTDPPYYDNIGYADLSDFFYVWLRQSLKGVFPKLFGTMLVPKAEELIATPYRFDGDAERARIFFESGMLQAFTGVYEYVRDDIPLTVYYAYKQRESAADNGMGPTGWETMLTAIIKAGFLISATWPVRTEQTAALKTQVNAIAYSIVLVCRKRPAGAHVCTRRDFIGELKKELKGALGRMQASNIAPVKLAQSAVGPGLGVYSRFSKVLEADGTPMSVRSALQIINTELDICLAAQDGELDCDSLFCVDLYTQIAFNSMKFEEADVLARAKNTSVEKLSARGVLYARKRVTRLLTREEISYEADRQHKIIWLFTQQLTKAMEENGVAGAAEIIADIYTSEPDRAKALAYRLFTVAERKGWTSEAAAYNALVAAWPEVQQRAAGLQPKA